MLLKFTDWKAILLCVFTAAIFWVFNSLNKQYTTNVYYPIKLTGFSRDSLFEVLPPPKYIAVNVTGQGWMLLRRSLGFGNETIEIVIPSPTATRRIVGKDLFPLAEEAIGGRAPLTQPGRERLIREGRTHRRLRCRCMN